MQTRTPFFLSIAAGLLIGIGGSVFLACENRYVGAVLFSVALLSICYQGLFLYTGKIGYIAWQHDRQSITAVVITLAGNLIGTLAAGLSVGVMKPAYVETARTLCEKKLAMAPLQVLIAGVFCGMLMYLAVEIYKSKQTPVGILFCVPVFILSGFEHSIADLFYFFTARIVNGEMAWFLLLVVVGNSVGGMLIPWLKMAAGEKYG